MKRHSTKEQRKQDKYTTTIARRAVIDRFAKLREEISLLSGVEIQGHGHLMDLLATYADDWAPQFIKKLSTGIPSRPN